MREINVEEVVMLFSVRISPLTRGFSLSMETNKLYYAVNGDALACNRAGSC